MRQDWLLGSFITVGLCVYIGGSNCLIFTRDFSIGVDIFLFYFLLLIITIKGEHKKLGKILLFGEIYDRSLFILPAYNQHSISICLALRSHVDVYTGHAFIILYTGLVCLFILQYDHLSKWLNSLWKCGLRRCLSDYIAGCTSVRLRVQIPKPCVNAG